MAWKLEADEDHTYSSQDSLADYLY